MNAILYGNLSVEIVSDLGTRLERVTLRQAATDLLRSRRPEQVPRALMLGREREAAAPLDGIWAGGPVGFHAACGYGKTTLLQNVAAAASERGLAPSCIYLRADGDRIGDLLQHLVARLYVSDQPVKLTPQECAWLLGQVAAIIAVDDLNASPGQVGYLIGILPACGLVIGSTHPVLGPRGSSHNLAGLPEETALTLVASDLGRPLAAEELAAARRLVAAVDGQPLHLRQCAALVGEGRHSFRSLARHAAHDVEVLDRLSISALAQFERRALAVLALAAGALLPITVVETVGQIAYAVEWLESLHRRAKPARVAEPALLGAAFAAAGVPVVARLAGAARADGGDFIWLDERTMLAGRSYRTNAEGVRQPAQILAADGASLKSADLPPDPRPGPL